MAYDNNETEFEHEPAQPKKADVLIRSTQTIVSKQQELAEQTKFAISKIDEAINLCHQNSEEARDILEHSTEMFERLQAENSALKQELLYLAKQSENIYAGLAEKLNEMQSENARQQVQPAPAEEAHDASYYELADRLAEIYDRLAEMTARIDALSARKTDDGLSDKIAVLNDKFAVLYDKLDMVAASAENVKYVPASTPAPAPVHNVNIDTSDITDKLDRIMDIVRKNEGAHSMLADKFEILSMRVEQFGFESAKPQPQFAQSAPQATYPAPAPVQATAEIDYDKLASMVADILPVRETVSPDYIASKVAEQIVLPEADGAVEVDTQKIAEEVAALIGDKQSAPVEINEDAIVDRLAEKMSEIVSEVKVEPIDEQALADAISEKLGTVASETAAAAPVEIDEEVLADRIAEKLGAVEKGEVSDGAVNFDEDSLVEKIVERLTETVKETARASAAGAEIGIDQEELADMIALKVGSLKPEDFEILVDDLGCASISREIAEKIDYNEISTIIADKLREILELNIANAPDYEDMAERISEKITVAGVNEDAIAEKAAAVLSNYLPEFDTEEIADKITGAVIDVVAAMPQPTLDSEAICNEISERLIEKQEDNNYDIVIDDDGISKITEIVAEEIEKNTDERFNKLEESIASLTDMLTVEEEEVEEEEAEELSAEEEVSEEEAASLSEIVADEIEKGTASRFDKVEEDIARIYDIVSSIVVDEDEEVEETEDAEYDENEEEVEETVCDDADYTRLSEIVANEIEKGVTARLDSVEEKLDSLTEMLTVEEEEVEEDGEEEGEEYEEGEEEYAEDVPEEEYQSIFEILSQMETNLTERFDSVEEKITSLTELMSEEVEEPEEEVEDAEESEAQFVDVEDEEYTKLSEIVSARFDSVEEKIANLAEMLTAEEEIEEVEEFDEATEEDYTKLSEIVAGEIEKGVSARFDSVEENIRRINAIVSGLAVGAVSSGNGNVEADIRLYEQFDKVADDIKRISEYVEGDVPVMANERLDAIAKEINRISQVVEGEISVETNARLDKIQEEIEQLSAMLSGAVVESNTAKPVNNNDDKEQKEREERERELREREERERELRERELKERERDRELREKELRDRERDRDSRDREILERVEGGVDEIKGILINGVTISDETAAVQTAEVEEEEQLVTVSDIVKPISLGDDEDEDDDDFLLSAIDMDKFSDDERMPGEFGELDGVDFENMMKYNRSFIARIIQSDDDCKQYYGAVKHALLSYKKVNSNVAWGNERFNKGRETIARMKIRGKTLVIYLALDPNEYKTSVYHHIDVSDNKSVLGTPMMIKVKSPLGVRKAIRLIDEMLEKRNGEKRELPERDYAAMYPYETIEELIEDGLVKDVRKK